MNSMDNFPTPKVRRKKREFPMLDKKLQVISEFKPAGDQPEAIKRLAENLRKGDRTVVLRGATGTGKSATSAWLIEEVQRPTLILVHNKTLAAQLAAELRELLPDNAVSYFVSHFAFYQPEAYVAQTDTYIEKDSAINEEVERLRHAATMSLLTRRDTVVVASVSAIYGLGTPEEYTGQAKELKVGDDVDRDVFLRELVAMGFDRNDTAPVRGSFRVRGDTVEVLPTYDEQGLRIEFFGDEIENLSYFNTITGNVTENLPGAFIFPATHYVSSKDRTERALKTIRAELEERVNDLKREGKLLEAQRLQSRTEHDLEMIEETGRCAGIENYSRHFDGRAQGSAPATLLDYFPDDFLLVVDESHVTIPQIGGMYEGDQSRKRSLVDHGFRLPSALDNRPLQFNEFMDRVGQGVYLSATPAKWELELAESAPVEQIIRPTGLLDPIVEVRPSKGQIDDIMDMVKERAEKGERSLVTTLTKKMAEDLTAYLSENGVRVRYLHSDIDTMERIELLRDLRKGVFDVLVGINLLREGLDLPEVSLVAILDADKQGFLRSATSLIQTIGRAARNVDGFVALYADKITDAMSKAISETSRRRAIQEAHNAAHGVSPRPLQKKIIDIAERAEAGELTKPELTSEHPQEELSNIIQSLQSQMEAAASGLQFELAGRLRDEIKMLQKELKQIVAAGM